MLDETTGTSNYLWVNERLGVFEVGVKKVLDRKLVGVFGRVDVALQGVTGTRLNRFKELLVLSQRFANHQFFVVALVAGLVHRVETLQV